MRPNFEGKKLVEEVPVAITINSISYAVMLASPYDLDDFAFGFLLSEQVISNGNQIHDVVTCELEHGIGLDVTLANRQLHKFQQQQRRIKGTSGCGLCGKEALDVAFPELPILEPYPPLSNEVMIQLKPRLKDWQSHAKHSGAMHAAFWVDQTGEIVLCREDIGRHNAVDKVIGAAVRDKRQAHSASLLVTSRCSIEIVQKAILSQVSSLISLASPTQMAFECALKHNLNLIHIPRRDKPVVLTATS